MLSDIHDSALRLEDFRQAWWVRHGESVGNAGARTDQPGTYSLTERGFAQSAQFAGWLERVPDLIVTSPYTRARETGAATIARHAAVPVEEWPVQEICYLAPARCVQTTQIERRAMARGFWDLLDPDFVDGEGAESFAEFIGRATAALERLRARREKFIVIFSHAIFMRGLLWVSLTRPGRIDREAMQLFHHFSLSLDVPNCGVLPMIFAPDGALAVGPIEDPTGTATAPPTAEQIRLSGL